MENGRMEMDFIFENVLLRQNKARIGRDPNQSVMIILKPKG